MNRRSVGGYWEEHAVTVLQRIGYTVIERNFRFSKRGEIDLIMRDGSTIVFVEVKSRTSAQHGLPEEAVTWSKQRTIRRVAEAWCALRDVTGVECRFDVMAIESDGTSVRARHYIDCF
ncbi:MAG: YraN family protein [Bacteroidetes bacterium]|nr:YraN family protein [Bacteroidota bacterium]